MTAALLAALLFLSISASGQTPGSIDYNSGQAKLQFYNGTAWVDIGNGTSIGTCSTPGHYNYDTTNQVFRFCNGSNWKSFAAQATSTSCSRSGEVNYDSVNSVFMF